MRLTRLILNLALMIKIHIIFKYLLMLISCYLLSACLGGTVAQQIARSIATSIVDKQIARAMDVDEDQLVSNRKPDYSNRKPYDAQAAFQQQSPAIPSAIMQPYKAANTVNSAQAIAANNLRLSNLVKQSQIQNQSDPYKIAIANTAFKELKPADLIPINKPLPNSPTSVEEVANVMQTSQLVPVELFNLIIGEEKNAVYEQARLIGALGLPLKREWQNWQVASGVMQSNKKSIIFLIPPEFGKLPVGSITMVELAAAGELNVARYKTQ